MNITVLEQFKATWLTTLFSGLLFLAVTYLLLWNEGQAILNSQTLDEATNKVVTIDVYNPSIKSDYEDKLVHLLGPIDIMEPLTEPDYNIQVMSVKLKKRVQMYQWIEETREKDKFGDTVDSSDPDITTYAYHRDWRDYVVDSSLFYISSGHHNPRDMPMSGQTYLAENVKIGWVYLGRDIKVKFSDYYDITSDERPERRDIKLHSGMYYHGADPLVHEIGDLRIVFAYAGRQDDEYSVIGMLEHGTIQPYFTAYSPDPLILLRKGRHSAVDMIKMEYRDAGWLAWRYRAVGLFQMFAAAMSLHPDWFTLLMSCRWVSPRMRMKGRLFTNITMATCATLFITSLPWIVYFPLLSLILLTLALLPIFYFTTTSRDSHNRD